MTEPAWRPAALGRRLPHLTLRARMNAGVRGFFAGRDYLEVETPALQISPGLEPHLKAFATELEPPDGGPPRRLYLHTSPEFAMKKLLAGGLPRIFQLARVFRNGERAATHHPEFTMLEWYRVGADYRDLMDETEALVRAVCPGPLTWQGRSCDPALPFERLSVAEAFRRHAGIAPLAPDLAAEARRIGVRVAAGDSREDLFFRIFLDRIEPKLGHPAATLLYDYPAEMAALSRLKRDDPRWAERFELYVAGLELANAFGELTDPAEQRRRFTADMDRKQALYGTRYPIDEDFLAALGHGLPDCAGIALGFDRLVMLAAGAARIEDVLWLPVAET
ncbi:MAG: EF-P lysine aminoacylase GenX [Alphaproteobacteria bacterium]|nr:EF-P lysine aminoacylase GenX [Alphaproteobacteria bacterium]